MKTPISLVVVSFALAWAGSASVLGQGQEPGPEPTFEVASVKRTSPGATMMAFGGPPGTFRSTNLPLRNVIQSAYDMRDYQVIGGPSWLTSDRFDIVGREPQGTFTPEQRRRMIQLLLADRFAFAAHAEKREMPVYNLVFARDDRRFGPHLKATTVDCVALRKARASGAAPQPAPPRFTPGQGMSEMPRAECNTMMMMSPQEAMLSAGGLAFEQATRMISSYTGRPVVDLTGLKGEHDMTLRFVPEPGAGPFAMNNGVPLTQTNSDVPNIFTAVQEQLGLKLESARGMVDVLVIDSVSQPTED